MPAIFITFHLVNDAGVDQTLSSKDLKKFYIFENDCETNFQGFQILPRTKICRNF
jgi:hypothetical protein